MSTVIRKHRFLTALLIFVSGLALLPLISMQTQSFGWEAFADAYIFADDFESGDESAWSRVLPSPPTLFALPSSSNSLTVTFRLTSTLWEEDLTEPLEVLAGFTDPEQRAFSMEIRRRKSFEMRGRILDASGKWEFTDWVQVRRKDTVEVVWQREMAGAEDGALFLTVNDELRAWLTDLATAPHDMRYVGLVKLGEIPAVTLQSEQ